MRKLRSAAASPKAGFAIENSENVLTVCEKAIGCKGSVGAEDDGSLQVDIVDSFVQRFDLMARAVRTTHYNDGWRNDASVSSV